MGLPGQAFFIVGSKQKKKCWKNSGATVLGAFCGNKFGSSKVWGLFYFEGTKERTVTAFKGTIRKFLKVLTVLNLGLRHH
jgi:hypothetical protein